THAAPGRSVLSRKNTSHVAHVANEGHSGFAYPVRLDLGRQCLVQVATCVSKQHCADCHRSKRRATWTDPGLDLLLGPPCERQSAALCPDLSDDRNRDRGLARA